MDDRDVENVSDGHDANDETSLSVGEKLRAQRESANLSLNDIAARTRVPIRHLEAIEAGDYGALPGSTYSLGFTRSYAKTLGLDEATIVSQMREELAQGGFQGVAAKAPAYEPTDPARVPSRWLAWTAAGFALVLIAAYFVWRSFALSPDAGPATAPAVAEAPIGNAEKDKAKTAANAATPTGPVVISATDTVWVKIYDADNKRLFENEMKSGDSFTVPADANKPMIVTGRPQVLNVTVGGKPVPPLGTGDRSIADVDISAAALLARPTETAATTPREATAPPPANQ